MVLTIKAVIGYCAQAAVRYSNSIKTRRHFNPGCFREVVRTSGDDDAAWVVPHFLECHYEPQDRGVVRVDELPLQQIPRKAHSRLTLGIKLSTIADLHYTRPLWL
jgi:hypothetical protein